MQLARHVHAVLLAAAALLTLCAVVFAFAVLHQAATFFNVAVVGISLAAAISTLAVTFIGWLRARRRPPE